MTTQEQLNLLTRTTLSLSELTNELFDTLTDLKHGLLQKDDSFSDNLLNALGKAKSNAEALNQLLNSTNN